MRRPELDGEDRAHGRAKSSAEIERAQGQGDHRSSAGGRHRHEGGRGVGGALGTAPLAAGSHAILYGTLGGQIVSVDPSNGKPRETYSIGGPVRSQPVVDGGWIYVGTEDGRLVAIDTKDPLVTGWPTWGGNAQRTGIATFE